MLKHSLRGLIVGVGDCLPDCPEHRIVFGLQAGVGLFDRQLDILTDQPSASSKEDGPIGLGRLDHRLWTFVSPAAAPYRRTLALKRSLCSSNR
jgi:hypothetical protein